MSGTRPARRIHRIFTFFCCAGRMTQHKEKRLTQKDFIAQIQAEKPYIGYEYPGIFRTEAYRVEVRIERISAFLAKLAPVMDFKDYDRLTRSVWVAHYRLADNAKGWWNGR